MIHWEQKRFACESCIKGHRATKCSHLKKCLKEIKTKGRPNTQCPTCREKRQLKTGHPHHKCQCGSEPPKSYIYHLKLQFEQGLQLEFSETDSRKVQEIQSKLDSKASFLINVVDKDSVESSNEWVSLNLIVDKQETKTELEQFLNNPCKCHFGGECICSKRKVVNSDPVEKDAVLALANLLSEQPTQTQGCSCSKDCSQKGSGCACGCSDAVESNCGCSKTEESLNTEPSSGPKTRSCCS